MAPDHEDLERPRTKKRMAKPKARRKRQAASLPRTRRSISAGLRLSPCSKIRWISRPSRRVILSGIHAYYEPEELIGKTLIAITNLPPRPMMGIESCGMLLSAVNERNGEEELHLLMVDNHIPAGAKLY